METDSCVGYETPQTTGVAFTGENLRRLPGIELGPDGFLSDRAIGNIRSRIARPFIEYSATALTTTQRTSAEQILSSIARAGIPALSSAYPGTGQILKFGKAGMLPTKVAGSGVFEYSFRTIGGVAYAIALCIRHGLTVAGYSKAQLVAQLERFAGSMLKAHCANNTSPFPESDADYAAATTPSWGAAEGVAYEDGDWMRGQPGYMWQSALWVALAGRAVWVAQADLSAATVEAAKEAVTWEASRFLTAEAPYWMSADDWIVSPGDTKAEENAWNAACIALAYSWTGEATYRAAAIRFALSAQTTRQNVELQDVVSGVNPVELGGWNLLDNYLLVNHGEIHPNYVVGVPNLLALVVACFAEREGRVPHALVMNIRRVYDALQNVKIQAGQWGYTRTTPIYIRDSDKTAYPKEDTNEPSSDKLAIDLISHALGDPHAETWAALHTQKSLGEIGTYDGRNYGHWTATNIGAAFELVLSLPTAVIEEA